MVDQRNAVGRRKYPRRQFKRPLGVLFDGKYRVAQGVELGEGGLSFRINDKDFLKNLIVPEGEEGPMSMLGLVFKVPSGKTFTVCRAYVRSLRLQKDSGPIVGCQFIEVDFDHRREIRNFVTSSGLA